MAYNDSTGDVWREAVRRTRHVYDGESVRDAKIVIDYLIAEVCILLEEMEHEKMIPRIPEGCERFRQDEIGRWGFQFPGYEEDAEWDLVDAIRGFAGPTPELRLLWRDLCNAARCAWLDEAERVVVGDDPFQYEKDYAHCLAWAEAWAREAKG